ncbi:14795_t:CDS:2, partial [Dentiscutata heterogama]
ILMKKNKQKTKLILLEKNNPNPTLVAATTRKKESRFNLETNRQRCICSVKETQKKKESIYNQ